MKEYLKEMVEFAKLPIGNILTFFGVLLVGFSFVIYDGTKNLALTSTPNFYMFIPGLVLIPLGIIIFLLTREDRAINKKRNIKDGLTIAFGQTSVNLRVGWIEEIKEADKFAAVVLPANTSFVDDCITDKNSALGSFVLARYPSMIPTFTVAMEKGLEESGALKNHCNEYPPGTTIIMPPPFESPTNILITAATVRKMGSGIRAAPGTICECIRQIFVITCDKKISKISMPVLGSGHGGLEINAALLFLLLSIKYYSNQYHHIKLIDIIVTEKAADKLKDFYRIQYLTLLGGTKK